VITVKPLKSKISISLDWDLVEKLKVIADYDERSLSQYINIVMKARVEEVEANAAPKLQRLLQGLNL